jgi:hypothetical protein
MLKAIETVLEELGLRKGLEPIRYSISISNGSTISVSAYVDSHRFYQIKVAESATFEGEYRAQMHGREKYRELVPQPLGRIICNGWDIFVAQGIPHKPFSFEEKGKGRAFDKLLEDLNQYFLVSTSTLAISPTGDEHDRFLDHLQEYFKHSSISSIANKCISQGRLLGICNLPRIAQHGDFVLNNMAYCRKNLVVFDWEDYSKYWLPGLDICTFCFSVAPNTQSLQSLMQSRTPSGTAIDKLVRGACETSKMDVDIFRRLIPLYLLIFLYAKREYGAAVQSRISATLSQLDLAS